MDFSPTGATVTALSSGEIVFTNTLQIVGTDASEPAELAFDFPLATNTVEVTAPSSYSDYLNLIQGLALTNIQDVAVKVNNVQMPHLPFVWQKTGKASSANSSIGSRRTHCVRLSLSSGNKGRSSISLPRISSSDRQNYLVVQYPNDCEQTIFMRRSCRVAASTD